MYILENKKDCCGCESCLNICPVKAIEMKEDLTGFNYPVINSNLCIKCNMCKNVCPILNVDKLCTDAKNIYALKNKNEEVRNNSSSGGVFFELARLFIGMNGVVYGVLFDNLEVKHARIDNIGDLSKLRKSKYVQSQIGDCYNLVKKDLEKKVFVLFSGTPCQVDGLKKYLSIDYDNLITCDLICHGVTSPKLFQDHIDKIEKEKNKKIRNYDFRFKNRFSTSNTKITFIDDTILVKENDDLYELFSNYGRRYSCFSCKYSLNKRPGDITIGDFQDHKKVLKSFNDKRGVSLLIINNNKGAKYFSKIKNHFYELECKIENCLQPSLKERDCLNKDVIKFWNDYENFGYDYIIKKYIRNNLVKQFKRAIRHTFIRLKKVGDVIEKKGRVN